MHFIGTTAPRVRLNCTAINVIMTNFAQKLPTEVLLLTEKMLKTST